MSSASVRNSKKLSWLLRHGASESGLDMDPAGWAVIDDVLDTLDMRLDALLDAVTTNDKGRLQINGDRIRACQGHSNNGAPISREALEASWKIANISGSLWHGTSVAAIAGIAARGIDPQERTHVHLAAAPDSHVGKRRNVDLLLEISNSRLAAAGISVFEAPNGVLLVRHVPREAIVAVRAGTRRGAAAVMDAERSLGLSR